MKAFSHWAFQHPTKSYGYQLLSPVSIIPDHMNFHIKTSGIGILSEDLPKWINAHPTSADLFQPFVFTVVVSRLGNFKKDITTSILPQKMCKICANCKAL